jgi:hypothetical protein
MARGANGRYLKEHGMRSSPTYVSWQRMIQRCTNPSVNCYPEYGGAGIKVCARWLTSFAAFLEDMGPRPSKDHSLDRYPNQSGNYEPGNCRWATLAEQHRNKKSNRRVTFRGETKCVTEWAEITGLSRTAIARRLSRGWPVESALTVTADRHKPPMRTARGKK